jgi:hypothetical protein
MMRFGHGGNDSTRRVKDEDIVVPVVRFNLGAMLVLKTEAEGNLTPPYFDGSRFLVILTVGMKVLVVNEPG